CVCFAPYCQGCPPQGDPGSAGPRQYHDDPEHLWASLALPGRSAGRGDGPRLPGSPCECGLNVACGWPGGHFYAGPEHGNRPLTCTNTSWARLGSNQWPLLCESSALPLSYAPQNVIIGPAAPPPGDSRKPRRGSANAQRHH